MATPAEAQTPPTKKSTAFLKDTLELLQRQAGAAIEASDYAVAARLFEHVAELCWMVDDREKPRP